MTTELNTSQHPYEIIPGTFNVALLAQQIAEARLWNLIKVYWTDRIEVDLGITDEDRAKVEALIEAHNPNAELPPDNPTLGDWRVGLTLWGRLDDITERVNTMVASTAPATAVKGKVAKERLEYSNNVVRAELMQLKDAFGFTAEEVDESLWRADRVRQGDLSGIWPIADA